jgi:hypothetical protein
MLMLMQMQCNYGAKHQRCYSPPPYKNLVPRFGNTRGVTVVTSTFYMSRLLTSWGLVGLGCEPMLHHSMVLCQDNVPPLSDRSICPSALGLLISDGKPSPLKLSGSIGPTTPFWGDHATPSSWLSPTTPTSS